MPGLVDMGEQFELRYRHADFFFRPCPGRNLASTRSSPTWAKASTSRFTALRSRCSCCESAVIDPGASFSGGYGHSHGEAVHPACVDCRQTITDSSAPMATAAVRTRPAV